MSDKEGDRGGGGPKRPISGFLAQAHRIAGIFLQPANRSRETPVREEPETEESEQGRSPQEYERDATAMARETWTESDTLTSQAKQPPWETEKSGDDSPRIRSAKTPAERLVSRIAESLGKMRDRAGRAAATAVERVLEAASHASLFSPEKSQPQEEAEDIAAHAYTEFLYEGPSEDSNADQPADEDKSKEADDTAAKNNPLPDLIPRDVVPTPLDIHTGLDAKSTTTPEDAKDEIKTQPLFSTPPEVEEDLQKTSRSQTIWKRIRRHSETPKQDDKEDPLEIKSSHNDVKETLVQSQKLPKDEKETLLKPPLNRGEVTPNQGEMPENAVSAKEVAVDEPDDIPVRNEPLLRQGVPQNQSNEKNQLVPEPSAQITRTTEITEESQGGTYDHSANKIKAEDISENKSGAPGSSSLFNEENDEESTTATSVTGSGGGAHNLLALKRTDPKASKPGDAEGSEPKPFSRGSSCECVEELRKYVDPPRVFTQGLEDYGDDQDQFIARRGCSQMSKRYLRCERFWVSTCKPPKAKASEEEMQQWDVTCPPPPRRSVQQCIKEKEQKHEEARKRAAAARRDNKHAPHVPTASPRLCRSIYDEDEGCLPPPGSSVAATPPNSSDTTPPTSKPQKQH